MLRVLIFVLYRFFFPNVLNIFDYFKKFYTFATFHSLTLNFFLFPRIRFVHFYKVHISPPRTQFVQFIFPPGTQSYIINSTSVSIHEKPKFWDSIHIFPVIWLCEGGSSFCCFINSLCDLHMNVIWVLTEMREIRVRWIR